MAEWIEIVSGASRARISRRGAELKSFRVGAEELIWAGAAASWPESAPILFPVVGWTRDGVLVEGRRYPLGLHGFARALDFELAARAEDRARFRLTDSAATRALYPFSFILEVEYIVDNNMLKTIIDVKNEGGAVLPFACGWHPGFVWPLPGGRGPHVVRFDRDEACDVPIIASGGLFSAQKRRIPLRGRELELTPELFAEALCFLDARSRKIEFFDRESGAGLTMTLQNFPHLALWSLPGAKFLCIEAWTGHGDPEDFDGDIFAKPSMRLLGPGEAERSAATVSWRAGTC